MGTAPTKAEHSREIRSLETTPQELGGAVLEASRHIEGMASDNTRRSVRRELEAAAIAGLDVATFARRAVSLLRRSVRFDACCFATVDPATLLITGAIADGLDEARAPRLFEIEYARGDVNGYRALAQANVSAATLHGATAGDPSRSARFDEILRPLGFGHEMRVVFSSGGRTWGVAGLMRDTAASRFDDDEVRAVQALTETIAGGLRASLLVEVVGRGRGRDQSGTGPAVIVVDGDDAIEVITPAASARLEDMAGYVAGALPPAILTTVSAARSVMAAGAKLRVRGASGAWWVVSATAIDDGSGRRAKVVATIEEARAPDVVPLVVAAVGLSGRERDVLVGVLEGLTSGEIAADLGISTHTVNDHLKSIFAKADVRSRRELVAKIFFEQYAPRLGAPLATGGWFAES